MYRLIWIVACSLLSLSVSAQDLFHAPESVLFDEARNRYLVSNWDGNSVSIIDSLGNQSFFATNIYHSGGMCISGDTLWLVADHPSRVLAYDLETGALLEHIPDAINGEFYDSMVLDSSGNAYITVDGEFSSYGWIFKLDLSDYSMSIFADSGVQFPQAIRFNAEENALIFCSAKNNPACIKKLTLNDSVLTDLAASALQLKMDGVAFDEFGYTYVSSWDQNGVFRFDSNFTDPPEQIAFGFNGPAALCYNERDHILAVPDVLQSRVEFIQLHVIAESDTTWGWPPFEVSFMGSSEHEVDEWTWDFGDGLFDYVQSPTHVYQNPGIYNVNLTIDLGNDEILTRKMNNHIIVLADTLTVSHLNVEPNTLVEVVISATNTVPLNMLEIPVEYSGSFGVTLQSYSTIGCRTDIMQYKEEVHSDPYFKRSTFRIHSDFPNPILEPGSGPVLKLYFQTPAVVPIGTEVVLSLDGYHLRLSEFTGYNHTYIPHLNHGSIGNYICGDASGDTNIDLIDILYLIDYVYGDPAGPPPIPLGAGDANADGNINLIDILYLISFKYDDPPGPEPQCP